MDQQQKLVSLLILDGWGIAPPGPGNAVALANTVNFDNLIASYPHTQLSASGTAVGLPKGADGNSEVGHLNLGAGRIVPQDILRINQSITDGSFFQNQVFLKAVSFAQKRQSNLHLIGLIGGGVVHASNHHLYALLKFFSEQRFSKVFLHLFTDGRDSPPRSALKYIKEVEAEIKRNGVGQIASITGRYYAMDRDQRWQRTEKAYLALTEGRSCQTASTPTRAIEKAYRQNLSDEFILPTLISKNEKPLALIRDNDAVIFFNFRVDRSRQLTKAFVFPKPPFKRKVFFNNLLFTTMTAYEMDLPVRVAFPEETIESPLGEVLSQANLNQLRAAETEKERFVTYYFNGFREKPFKGEERLMVASPKVATYDLQPEMSIYLLTDKFITGLEKGNYHFGLINFANPDMVGHTGKIKATIRACEAVDECLGGIVDYVLSQNGTLIVTADHGNAEELINIQTGETDTKHSTAPVPLILVNRDWQDNSKTLPRGILADIAPTILKLLNLDKPEVMTGQSLINFQ